MYLPDVLLSGDTIACEPKASCMDNGTLCARVALYFEAERDGQFYKTSVPVEV